MPGRPPRGRCAADMRTLLAGITACLVALAIASPSAAAGLAYAGCLTAGPTPATGCTDLSAQTDSLTTPVGIVVAPAGDDVYAAAFGNAVTHLARDATTGELTFAGCVTGSVVPASGCTDLSAQTKALDWPRALAISPDGASIYVAGGEADAVAHLVRDPATGTLSFGGCFAGRSITGCTDLSGVTDALEEPAGVAVSPDGANVYVAAAGRDAMLRFDRDGTTGGLTYAGCLTSDAGTTGCDAVPSGTLDRPQPLVVSADGKQVYVGTVDGSTITQLARAPDGALAFAASTTHAALQSVNAVALSPDGTSLYASSTFGNAIVHFARAAATGTLSFADCLSGGEFPTSGCGDAGAAAMGFPAQPVVSPDGTAAYALGTNAVVRLSRAPSGALAYEECLTSDGPSPPVAGCTVAEPETDALSGVAVLALSPDGASLYAGSSFPDAISTFATGAGGNGAGGSGGSGGDRGGGGGGTAFEPSGTTAPPAREAGRGAPVISGVRVRRHGRHRMVLRLRLSEDAALRVAIQRGLPGRKWRRSCRPQMRGNRRARSCTRYRAIRAFRTTGRAGASEIALPRRIGRRLIRAGRYRVVLTATDASGNASRPAQATFRIGRR